MNLRIERLVFSSFGEQVMNFDLAFCGDGMTLWIWLEIKTRERRKPISSLCDTLNLCPTN